MTRLIGCLVLAACLQVVCVSEAQQAPSAKDSDTTGLKRRAPEPDHSEKPDESFAKTLRTSTQLVILDVVVQDKNGHPIHGLTRDNFVLTERRQPQAIRNFEEHSAASMKIAAP